MTTTKTEHLSAKCRIYANRPHTPCFGTCDCGDEHSCTHWCHESSDSKVCEFQLLRPEGEALYSWRIPAGEEFRLNELLSETDTIGGFVYVRYRTGNGPWQAVYCLPQGWPGILYFVGDTNA